MESISGQLAKFIEETKFEDLPEDVIQISRRSIMDNIACALAGVKETSIQILEEFFRNTEEGKGKSTIIGSSRKASLLGSILLNASRADSQEYSDVNKIGGGHPGCMVVPAALGMAEHLSSSGKDLLLSVALGYEAHRVGIPLYPEAFRKGIHLVTFVGGLGVMASAGKLMNLSQKELKNAFGICAVVPAPPLEPCRVGGHTKDLYTGWAARTGVFACLLAKKGFTGTDSIFEGELGIYRTLGAQKPPQTVLEGLGREWIIRATCVKPHASCRFTHSSVDAALNLTHQHDFDLSSIEKIEVTTDTIPFQLNKGSTPSTPIDARFSIPFTVALALTKKRPIVLEDFLPKMLHDSMIREIAKKVEVKLDKSLDDLYPEPPEGKGYRTSIMKIHLFGGKELTSRVDYPKGDPKNPVTIEEVSEKLQHISRPLLGKTRTEALIELLLNLEDCQDCGSLVRRLSLPKQKNR
jgi:2-methylcitrate dehydratase PrpD